VIAWRKSSFSDTASSCVEVRRESDVVYVRDSKLGDHSPIQEWPVEDWLFLTDAIASKQPKFSGYLKLDDGGIRLGWARLGHSPLWFNADEWTAFEYGVRAGELDPETLSSPVAVSRGGEPAAGRPVGSDTADGSDLTLSSAVQPGSDAAGTGASPDLVPAARIWVLAEEPGLAVTHVVDADGDQWTHRLSAIDGCDWHLDEEDMDLSWPQLLVEYGPLTDATPATAPLVSPDGAL
jgi:hypothetical protein